MYAMVYFLVSATNIQNAKVQGMHMETIYSSMDYTFPALLVLNEESMQTNVKYHGGGRFMW
jgi:hypothetical protein